MNTKNFYNQPWAICHDKLWELDGFLRAHCVTCPNGNRALAFRSDEIAAGQAAQLAAEEAAAARAATRPGSVAVLGLYGPLIHRADPLMELFGFTSLERFARRFRDALANPDVGTIVLDIDSPGGEVFGTPEMADEIYAARNLKKIVAVANPFAASGAYFLGSQASEFVVTPSGQVGSVGVYMLHVDWSKALELEGIKPTFISAGKFKTEGNPLEPLDESALAHFQARVDTYYEMFVKAVARGRDVTPKKVREDYGQGSMVLAAEAKSLGMVDRLATLDQVLERLGAAAAPRPAGARTEEAAPPVEVAEAEKPEVSSACPGCGQNLRCPDCQEEITPSTEVPGRWECCCACMYKAEDLKAVIEKHTCLPMSSGQDENEKERLALEALN